MPSILDYRELELSICNITRDLSYTYKEIEDECDSFLYIQQSRKIFHEKFDHEFEDAQCGYYEDYIYITQKEDKKELDSKNTCWDYSLWEYNK